MKHYFKTIGLGLAFVAGSFYSDISLSRGRGGGGAGPGGGFNPSKPTRQAPSTRPSPPANGPRPGNKPNRPNPGGPSRPESKPGNRSPGPGPINPRPDQPNRPGGTPRPGGRPGAGDGIGRNPPGHMPGNPGNRPGYPGYHKAEMSGRIDHYFHMDPRYGYPLSRNWYSMHRWPYARWPYWAGVATGATIGRWMGFPYGGYGSSQTLVYYPVESAPPETYLEQVAPVQEQASQWPSAPVDTNDDWLNLGAFGIIPLKATDFRYMVQLSTLKDGTLRGIQWDVSDDSTAEVWGSVDQKTQRIAWQLKDNEDAPYYESTVDELTQEEFLVNVYDPKVKSLTSWQMIQIKQEDLPKQ